MQSLKRAIVPPLLHVLLARDDLVGGEASTSSFSDGEGASYLSQTEPLPSYVLMPATKQPNMRPQKRNVDLRKGLPKN